MPPPPHYTLSDFSDPAYLRSKLKLEMEYVRNHEIAPV